MGKKFSMKGLLLKRLLAIHPFKKKKNFSAILFSFAYIAAIISGRQSLWYTTSLNRTSLTNTIHTPELKKRNYCAGFL